MSGKLTQRLDGRKTPQENCKDLAVMLNLIFMILERWMNETSGHGMDKKRDTGELAPESSYTELS